MNSNQPITADDLRQLAETVKDDAALIGWLDSGEQQIVSRKLFNDISYEHRLRPHETIVTQTDLELLANERLDELTPTQFSELAICLNAERQTF